MPLKHNWKQNLGLIPALLCLFTYSVSAQSLQLGDLTAFHKDGLLLESTDTLEEGRYELTIDGNYGRQPTTRNSVNHPSYASIFSPRASFTLGLTKRLHLSVRLPIHRAVPNVGGDPQYAPGYHVSTRWRLRSERNQEGLSAALVSGVRGTFHDKQSIVSNDGSLLFARLILQHRWDPIRGRAQIGYEKDTTDQSPSSSRPSMSGLSYGVGAEFTLFMPKLAGFFEWHGKYYHSKSLQSDLRHAAEYLAGARFVSNHNVVAKIGAGQSAIEGIGTTDLRLVFQLSWSLAQTQETPLPFSGTPEGLDPDQDGLIAPFDQCPTEPEDRDGFRDDDGCPEFDNDRDSILDRNDRCINEPEDKDGFQDEDGCPDPDNDADGIPDTLDACPNDRLAGHETASSNGCPTIKLHGSTLNIGRTILFESGSAVLPENATSICKEVMKFMSSQAPNARLRIEGFTDLWGSESYNRKLARQRALKVKRRLMVLGFDEARIEVLSRPLEAPIGDGRSPNDAQRSRRVEFYLGLTNRGSSAEE